jgi:hydroxyethylthiazole kinase-like uncharacterized protein yjeF
MYLVNNEEMRALDRAAMHDYHIPSMILMENAGIAIMQQLMADFPGLDKLRVLILCGSGNNGGDGLVLARQLLRHSGAQVSVAVLFEGDRHPSDDHAANRDILDSLGLKVIEINSAVKLRVLHAMASMNDLVVDCLFGTGLSRPLSDFYSQAVDLINQSPARKIAVDIPSGLNGDDGHIRGNAVRADLTYTIAFPKTGLYVGQASGVCGRIRVLDIGIPYKTAEDAGVKGLLLDEAWLKDHLPDRPAESHKNTFGHVGIIAGSPGMSGACVLSAKGALRSGAGLVTVLADREIQPIAAIALAEAMVRPVSWPNDKALDWLADHTKVQIIGPGMGKNDMKRQVLQGLLGRAQGTVVVDADALSLLAEDSTPLTASHARCILTPHPGEMARLLGKTNKEVQEDRLGLATAAARGYRAVVVLKGHHTVIACPDGRYAVNACDSASLATAGSGDVLTGIIAAFAAQGLEPFEAACAGVVTHGLAGMHLEQTRGVAGTIAGDIADAAANVLLQMSNKA